MRVAFVLDGDAIDALGASLAPAKAASSLPPDCYTDESVARLERDAVFGQSWFCVGRSDMVPGSGHYKTLDVVGRSLILLRDRDHVLRVFANACRHRGAHLDATLAEDSPALENQQRGLACGDAKQGRPHPLLEANVSAFARWYAAQMCRPETGSSAPEKARSS